MNIVYIIGLAVAVLFLAGYCRFHDKEFRKEVTLNDKRDAVTTKALASLASKTAWLNEELKKETAARLKASAEMEAKFDAMQEKLDKLPVEQFEDEVSKMKDWNDGWSEIVSFGKNVPKLNKEGLKHE